MFQADIWLWVIMFFNEYPIFLFIFYIGPVVPPSFIPTSRKRHYAPPPLNSGTRMVNATNTHSDRSFSSEMNGILTLNVITLCGFQFLHPILPFQHQWVVCQLLLHHLQRVHLARLNVRKLASLSFLILLYSYILHQNFLISFVAYLTAYLGICLHFEVPLLPPKSSPSEPIPAFPPPPPNAGMRH